MKRVLALILMLCIVLSSTACENNKYKKAVEASEKRLEDLEEQNEMVKRAADHTKKLIDDYERAFENSKK